MSERTVPPALSASADVGGTFTDVVALHAGSGDLVIGKSPTQAEDPVGGIIGALAGAGIEISEVDRFFHGTTLGINALLERRGSKVGFLTTEGFRDLLAVGHGTWPLYRLSWQPQAPLVPRHLARDVGERIGGDGAVARPLDLAGVERMADELVAEGVEAIAVCFLNSYLNPEHELAAGRAIAGRHPEVVVTLSHELGQRFHELPRATTAVGEAYLRPTLRRYFDRLAAGLAERDFGGHIYITSSDGGVMSVDHARDRVLRTLVSGCASGICGAAVVARGGGWQNLLAIDMGGTSFDAAVIRDGQPEMSTTAKVADHEFLMPMLDLATIGAGGGSIADVDAVGALHVGPRSAGAKPGPVCYGRGGTLPTVTDAALVAGLLPSSLLDGGMSLSREDAAAAIEREVATPLSLSVPEAAQGIMKIVEAKMGRLLNELTIGKGLDPRDFTLFAYGGGGPLVAARLAEELGISTLVVPRHAGVFSAWGMQTLDVVHELSQTRVGLLDGAGPEELAEPFAPLEERVFEWLRRDGFGAEQVAVLRFLELRYASQDHALVIPFSEAGGPGMRAAFDSAHESAFGFTVEAPIEVVNYRVRAVGQLAKTEPATREYSAAAALEPSWREVRERDSGEVHNWPVYQRDGLALGTKLSGPAIVEEQTATTIVPAGWSVGLHPHGHLVISK